MMLLDRHGNPISVVIPSMIGMLHDVDVSTTPPAAGNGLVWDNTAKKWKPGAAGGVTGAVGFSTIHNYDIPLGTNTAIDTGWAAQFSEANGGVSLVSGIPTYAPGAYLTTVQLLLSWTADGHQTDLHTVQLSEAAVGSVIQVVNGNAGFYWQWQGWNWFTAPATSCALSVAYHSGPSGSASDMTVSGAFFSTLRFGDMP